MRETKTVWHPYPEEKPEYYKCVLATLEYDDGSNEIVIDYLVPLNEMRDEKWCYDGHQQKVIAWAELPNPYQEGAENE